MPGTTFSELVNAPPVAGAIDDVLGRRVLRSTAPVRVDPADGQVDVRRRALTHLASWWLYGRTRGSWRLDPRSGVVQVAEAAGDAANQASALRSFLADVRAREQLDREAVELAIDYGRVDRLHEASEPPYGEPERYGLYDEGVVAELLALSELFPAGLADVEGPVTVNDAFGFTRYLGVRPPAPNLVLDSTAVVPVVGDDEEVPRRRLRVLVGIALLDEFVERIGVRWDLDEEALADVDGLSYTDPAEQESSGLLGVAKAITDVIGDAVEEDRVLGIDAASHDELTHVAAYVANRGDLRRLPIDHLRSAPAYEDTRAVFTRHLVDAADHEGLRRIAAHYCEEVEPPAE